MRETWTLHKGWSTQQRQDGERPVTQYGEKIRDAEQQMTQILEKLPPSFAEQFQRYSELSETDPRAGEQLADELMNGPYGDLFDEYYFRNMCLKDWRKYDWKRGPVELYRNTAGEIEARDAANRRTMSAEERENTAPDRGGEDVVFADETGWIRKNYDPETSSIKEQIANNRDRLNKMDPVANITVPINLYNTSSALKWAVDYLKATGYRVDRQGFGTIWFQEAEINNGLNYADTPEERAALALLPRILKRGIEIGRHGDHKLRQKETITFAAPAVVNGSTVHMAAVVSAYKNRYYAHRVVLPDGTVFRFSENKENDATQEPLRGVPISESLAKATSAASSTRISHGTDSVKEHFSVEDSASEEAKDSYSVLPAKARDYVKRAERTLLEKIGKVLSIPKAARRDFLAETVRAITNEYLQNGTVSKQTIDGLFEQAYAQGVVADEEFCKQYKHIKDHLRSTAVTLAEQGLLSVLSVAESA